MSSHSYVEPESSDCALVAADPATVERVVADLPPDAIAGRMASIFDALSDPTRLRILMSLRAEELCVHAIARIAGISQSGVSHQLRLLRDCELVSSRRVGKHVIYRLSDDHVASLIDVAAEHAAEPSAEET